MRFINDSVVLLRFISPALFTLFSIGSVLAENCLKSNSPHASHCSAQPDYAVVEMPAGHSIETDRRVTSPDFLANGILVTEYNRADRHVTSNRQRMADLALADMNFDIRVDRSELRPELNVYTTDLRSQFQIGETVGFTIQSNYPDFITRAELALTRVGALGPDQTLHLSARLNASTFVDTSVLRPGDFLYSVKVYDETGRSNQTATRRLHLAPHTSGTIISQRGRHLPPESRLQNLTETSSFSIQGANITVSGHGVPGGAKVQVMGQEATIDTQGKFTISRIIGSGQHLVEIGVKHGGKLRKIIRQIDVPATDFVFTGLADLTVGQYLKNDLNHADPNYKRMYSDGRLAFYLKGKTGSGLKITASADTGNGDIGDIFRRLDDKDPRKVVRRLDPEDLYPNYGDDSFIKDDTPTSGRVYAKVKRDSSYLLWGDFKTNSSGAKLVTNPRALYGAQAHIETRSMAANDQPAASITAYAAQPDTLSQKDILRGTGGSIYFLSRQDINGGSESLIVQFVSPTTGRVVDQRKMDAGVDYKIDYMQGMLLLSAPLSSVTDSTSVADFSGGKLIQRLFVSYEYTPTNLTLERVTKGGRAEVSITNRLRLGVSGHSQHTKDGPQSNLGVDLHYTLGANSALVLEHARSDGPGFAFNSSLNGGLDITSNSATQSTTAAATRAEATIDLADLGRHKPGFVNLSYGKTGAGFAAPTQKLDTGQTTTELNSEIEISDRHSLGATYENKEKSSGASIERMEIRSTYEIAPRWSVKLGLSDKYETSDNQAAKTRLSNLGLRINWHYSDQMSGYFFGQNTLQRRGNISRDNRLGVGFTAKIAQRLTLDAEASDGDSGTDASARLGYLSKRNNEIYIGYALGSLGSPRTSSVRDRERKITAGTKFKATDTVSGFIENSWGQRASRTTIAETYGISYERSRHLVYTATLESGHVSEPGHASLRRTAISFGATYNYQDSQTGRLRLEYSSETGKTKDQNRKTWGLSSHYETRVDADWHFLTGVDALFSKHSGGNFRDGEYFEGTLGYARRPIFDDRLNLLLKYTYLHDLPAADQIAIGGTQAGPLQKSHVFSVDTIYDLVPKLSLGAKYAFRKSEVAARSQPREFSASSAHLAIIRADWHVIHAWDITAEFRTLRGVDTKVTETDSLIAVYRHLGNNLKLGVGFQNGNVSDDITDIDYVGQGIFINLVAKF